MATKAPSEREYHEAFRRRLVQTREDLGWSQADMAKAIGVSLDRYKKYEIRSKFPLHLLEQLSLVTHRDVAYWITGRLAARTAAPRLVSSGA
jgi:transcriptional regulator with XRE-family HTH domain